jgi:hypothetical protein
MMIGGYRMHEFSIVYDEMMKTVPVTRCSLLRSSGVRECKATAGQPVPLDGAGINVFKALLFRNSANRGTVGEK